MSGELADLDRRVRFVDSKDRRGQIVRFSELSASYVVLIGEPGIGKSTVLERAARLDSATPISVNAFLANPEQYTAQTLFLDALDLARSGDNADSRVHSLAAGLQAARVARWRLTCRAEDWHGAADGAALAAENDVAVVQLLPLDFHEAGAILKALGVSAPEHFLDQAEARGADGFTDSPLMLRLLHSVVESTGQWPATRFDLFDQATHQLVCEWNPTRVHQSRVEPSTLLDAAGQLALVLLGTGAEAIWRSMIPPPPSGEAARFVSRENSALERDVFDDLLDSALFRGEGDRFNLVHRTIAEFLAARTLANAVLGTPDRAAYPLTRALALIADASGRPPTELRGVYAWFAAHLARRGRLVEATRLLNLDPIAVLLYGDVACFDVGARQALLRALPAADPFFRAASRDGHAMAGLVSQDMAEDFRRILTEHNEVDHLRNTVLEALAHGPAMPELTDVLNEMVIDESQPIAHRSRAIQVLLNSAADRALEVRRLLEALSTLPASNAREELRVLLLADESLTPIVASEVAGLLVSYSKLPEDQGVMRLFPLQQRLRKAPCPELLDALAEHRSLPWVETTQRYGVQEILGEMFVAALDNNPEIDAARLVRWTEVIASDEYNHQSAPTLEAIVRWLDHDARHEIAFFEAILENFNPSRGHIANHYQRIAGRGASGAIVDHLLRSADEATDEAVARTRLGLAVDIVLDGYTDELFDAFWKVHARLVGEACYGELLSRLIQVPIPDCRQRESVAKARRRREKHVMARWRTRRLRRHLDKIEQGVWEKPAQGGAQVYLAVEASDGDGGAADVVRRAYPDGIADAIFARWYTLVQSGLDGMSPAEFGKIHGSGRWYLDELCVVAGLLVMLEQGGLGTPEALPPAALLCVLTKSTCIEDADARKQLEHLVITTLCRQVNCRDALMAFWSAAFEAGSHFLFGATAFEENPDELPVLVEPLMALMARHPDLEPQAIRAMARLLVKAGAEDRLPDLVAVALASVLSDKAQGFWLGLGVELDPVRFRVHLDGIADPQILTQALGDSSRVFDNLKDSLERSALTFEYLAPHVHPEEEQGDGVVTAAMTRHMATHQALRFIGSNSSEAAIERTRSLLVNRAFVSWRPALSHVLATQKLGRRDASFHRPSADAITRALAGGPPANSADLRAIVSEELRSLGQELHTGDTTLWGAFWNSGSRGEACKPKVENICRDRILERLSDRLRPYLITAAIPEAQQGEGTRTDMLVLSGAGVKLPVEVKRHNHPDLWIAAQTQLQGYAGSPGADGHGIYLVLWFGVDWKSTPPRPDGGSKPQTAQELETQLNADIPEELRDTTEIIVFDVSQPG